MSRLIIDYANCLDERVGEHGLRTADLENAAPQLTELTDQLHQSRGTGWERWRDLPFDPMRREHLDAVHQLVNQYRPNTRHLVVLGIGGSALGNIALHNALNPVTYNLEPDEDRHWPRLYVLDNVDPQFVGRTLQFIRRDDPKFKHTLINVISKSGETAETAAQFLIAQSMLNSLLGEKHAEHIVAVTDASKGTMRSICDRQGYASLPVPEGVGGRFSVLSPVGLFSAAMCGINIESLLDGAADMDERCSTNDPLHNPAAVLAWLLVNFADRGKRNHVLMPYCNGLYSMADWFRQLWAESLGKRVDRNGNQLFAGATPIKALGATDQHSQIQLYREGPNDKVIGFLEVDEFEQDVTIPSDMDIEPLRYLQGSSLQTLLNAEKRATEYALVESQRPNFTIRFPCVDAHSIGQFIQLWEITMAYAALMWNIDAFNQPAVETGKIATFGLMGRAGYEQWKAKVDDVLKPTKHVLR